MTYVIIAIIFILVLLIFIVTGNYLRLKGLNQNIDICSNNIEEALNKKKILIEKLIKKIDDEKLFDLYNKLTDELVLFEKEELLFNINWEINKYIRNNNLYENKDFYDDDINKTIKSLIILEEEIEGLEEYYNSNVVNYNEKYYKKPFTFIYNILKFNPKKGFKLRKLEEYEILKN